MKQFYLKRVIAFILVGSIINVFSSCDIRGRHFSGKDQAKKSLKEVLSDTTGKFHRFSPILDNKETAIESAEVVLFKVFGKDQILNERPYETYLIDGYWVIKGTLPSGYDGGTFQIILDSNDCRVVSLVHYR